MLPWQPIKFSDLDKIHKNRRGLLKKHFCKKNLNICSETATIASFHFSHYKSVETISCHSKQSSYPIGTKTQLFVPPASSHLSPLTLEVVGTPQMTLQQYLSILPFRCPQGISKPHSCSFLDVIFPSLLLSSSPSCSFHCPLQNCLRHARGS